MHFFNYLPHMLDSMDYISGSSFALGADHGCPFANAAQRFAEIARPANERSLERVLVHVMFFVGGGQHLRLVDVVHAQFLQYLRLSEVADAAFRHDRDRDRSEEHTSE